MSANTEIINIGDELLIGQVVNTNASWLAEELNKCGINVCRITIVPDKQKQILNALEEAETRANIIIVTGGLGPTKDDITKDALCRFFNTRLILDIPSYKNVEKIFSVRGFSVTEVNRKQAEIPEACRPIFNRCGTAPGMWFERNGKVFISMPGIPLEMKIMVSDFILPELVGMFETESIVHKTILTQGVGESSLAELIEEWESGLPGHIKLAYLPQPGIVRLRLTSRGDDKEKLKKEIDSLIFELQKIIPHLIFGYNNDTIEAIVGRMLKEKGQTISTAESCTGGYISHLLTTIPGSSQYYPGSIVAYSNNIKEQVLGIEKNIMIKFGAVSEQVVKEMALKVKEKTGTDYSIAVSGIAGPDGRTEEKPVGTTWIAIATPDKIIAEKFLFGENRERNIRRTAVTALNILRKEIKS